MKNICNKFNSPLAIILLAIVIRCLGILSRPIWYDEAFALLFAEKGFGAMLHGTLTQTAAGTADIHPLGYYTVLWMWLNIFGNSILAGRILSVLFNLLSLILVYQIALKLFNQKTALASALLFAILPFQAHYAQEIRMYALLSLLLLTSTFALIQAQAGNWKWWILFACSTAFAQYTHNLAVFYLIPLACLPIFEKNWKALRALIIAGFCAIILYLPWLIYLPAQVSKVNSFYWVEKPGVEKIFTLILYYVPNLPLPDGLLFIGLAISLLIIIFAGFQSYLAIKNSSAGNSLHTIWVIYLAFIPPLFLWAVSQIIPVYIERALLASHAIFCIWLAWVLTQTKFPQIVRWIILTLILWSSSMGLYQHLSYNGFPYGPYKQIGQYIKSYIQPADIIIHSNKLSYLPLLYFNPELPQAYIIDPPGSSIDTLAPATREVLGLREFQDIEQVAHTNTRIWFIIYQRSIEEYTAKDGATHPQLEYLEKRFTLDRKEIRGDIIIYVFTNNEK